MKRLLNEILSITNSYLINAQWPRISAHNTILPLSDLNGLSFEFEQRKSEDKYPILMNLTVQTIEHFLIRKSMVKMAIGLCFTTIDYSGI